MTIEEKRRALFEAWAKRKPKRLLPVYWRAFNAALDAVEIVLPEYTDDARQYGYSVADVIAAIESTGLGLKVKP